MVSDGVSLQVHHSRYPFNAANFRCHLAKSARARCMAAEWEPLVTAAWVGCLVCLVGNEWVVSFGAVFDGQVKSAVSSLKKMTILTTQPEVQDS